MIYPVTETQGMEKSIEKVAKNMLYQDIDIEIVAKPTGLTVKQTAELKKVTE
jgi:23S rRNA-/tRNA-specific pseudouridylate synthase